VFVQDGDRLVIPRDEGTVYVFGQVNRPGFIAHQAGAAPGYYLERAGGTSTTAANAYVIEAGSGRHIPLREAGSIGTGDMIFVDRRFDIADSVDMQRFIMEERRARSEARFRTAQTVLQVVGTAAGVLTTFLVLRSRDN
jgi:polysaccharide biosynthesis/export protein